jgi:tetraacyldisaccharide 4'-kinase
LTVAERLAACWYGDAAGGRWCRWLLPLALLFRAAAALRRVLYARAWLPAARMPVPVLVVGNITAGGTGKTPLVIWLAARLRAAGHRPGVISRGYGGRAAAPRAVDPDSDPAVVGDEPLLLARRTGCPVWIGRQRAPAAKALLAAHPEVDVLLCDDGLQHYALARDLEIAVLDGARGLGNGLPLPAGPLRESVGRLDRVDAIVLNGPGDRQAVQVPQFSMRLVGARFRNLCDPGREEPAAFFSGRDVHVLAGIGNPARFFQAVSALGVQARRRAFPDHHRFGPEDLPAGCVIMTEKDAVKCAPFAHADVWMLPVDAEVDPGLETLILDSLESRHGQQTARNPRMPAL